MNFTCNRETLQKYITNAERVTGKNSSLPILSSVLIATNGKSLVIRSTNLEVGVEFQIPAEIKEEGSVAVSGSLFSNILMSIPDEESVTVSVKDSVCKIITKTKNITVKGLLPDDFPTIPVINEGESFTIQSQVFIQGVKSVLMSAAISDIKPEISSVYVYQKEKSLVFVATDSFRLAEKKIDYNGEELSQGVIIPVKNIMEIVKLFDGVMENILFKITKTQISCVSKSVYVTSRVIQGVYPDYEQILPKNNTTEIVMLKQDLINTLKLSTLFSDKFNKIQFIVEPSQKKCLVFTKNSDIGETESNLTVTMSGEPIEISLNGKHLFDCLSVIAEDSIVMQCNGSNKPAVIRGLGDNSFVYLTMPLTK
ncbi:MAG: DNA polymerase III subunit beta [Candidatus Pacebacteria bacterium]|jgi:DNA polymerase-3 subunit beta|nr:DNA polymerase III subunit beta [Candidatus Paceibacterota bacterium]